MLRACLRSSESGWEPSCSRSTQPCPALRSTRLGPSRRQRRKAERRGRWVWRCKMHSSVGRGSLAPRAPPPFFLAAAGIANATQCIVYGVLHGCNLLLSLPTLLMSTLDALARTGTSVQPGPQLAPPRWLPRNQAALPACAAHRRHRWTRRCQRRSSRAPSAVPAPLFSPRPCLFAIIRFVK